MDSKQDIIWQMYLDDYWEQYDTYGQFARAEKEKIQQQLNKMEKAQ